MNPAQLQECETCHQRFPSHLFEDETQCKFCSHDRKSKGVDADLLPFACRTLYNFTSAEISLFLQFLMMHQSLATLLDARWSELERLAYDLEYSSVQQLIKERSDKSWITDRGIMAKTLVAPQEMVHHVLRFLYREAMTPRPWVQAQIASFQARVQWESHYVIGIHVRTGGMGHEGTRWGRFLNEKDVAVFKAYASSLTNSFQNGAAQGMNLRRADPNERDRIEVKMKAKLPVLWYVVSDQDAQKDAWKEEFGEMVAFTQCEMKHTNKGRQKKADPGFTCALLENYLLSLADTMVLTTRSTYGYLARHRTNVPFVTVDLGDYQKWAKMTRAQKEVVPLSTWTVDDL